MTPSPSSRFTFTPIHSYSVSYTEALSICVRNFGARYGFQAKEWNGKGMFVFIASSNTDFGAPVEPALYMVDPIGKVRPWAPSAKDQLECQYLIGEFSFSEE